MSKFKLFQKLFKSKSMKTMNRYLKIVVVIESALLLIFTLKITGNLNSFFETEKPREENFPIQIADEDLFQDNNAVDRTVEEEDSTTPKTTPIGLTPYNDTTLNNFKLVDADIDNPEVAKMLNADPLLKLATFHSEEFNQSQLKKLLEDKPKMKVYTLIELNKGLDFEFLYYLQNLKIQKIYQLSISDYMNKSEIFLYLPYYKINRLLTKTPKFIKKIHILEDYTAVGYYQLGMKSDKAIDKINFKLRYPHSKPGHTLLSINNKFSISDLNEFLPPEDINDIGTKNIVDFELKFNKDETVYFLSQIKSKISLTDIMKNYIRFAGKEINISEYKRQISNTEPELYQKYTQFTEKVVSSEYIQNIVKQFYKSNEKQIKSGLDEKSISAIWNQLYFILNRDIRYDWNKRKLFFSGNLPFNNIRDMYLTAKELAETRVGACTERTSLEIAVLRELGIAARTSTRLYHIYTEIYIPQHGWISTSTTLNEIPLCYSQDEKMAYFVEWEPDHPIRLKWTGFLLPQVVTESTSKKFASKKLTQ